MGLEVQRAELVHAEDDLGLAVLGYDLTVGDGVEVLDSGLLRGVVGVVGGLPGLHALKGDAFLAEQDAQVLVADVVDHPSATRKSASLTRLQVENGRPGAKIFLLDAWRGVRRGASPAAVEAGA
ncbi:hypothetical protein [Actinopolymorpha pittospori]